MEALTAQVQTSFGTKSPSHARLLLFLGFFFGAAGNPQLRKVFECGGAVSFRVTSADCSAPSKMAPLQGFAEKRTSKKEPSTLEEKIVASGWRPNPLSKAKATTEIVRKKRLL
jgi:hypothetical protein